MLPQFPLSFPRTMLSFFIVHYGLFGQVQLSPSVCFVSYCFGICLLFFCDPEAHCGTISPLSLTFLCGNSELYSSFQPVSLVCNITVFTHCFAGWCQEGNCQATCRQGKRAGNYAAGPGGQTSETLTLLGHLRTSRQGSSTWLCHLHKEV